MGYKSRPGGFFVSVCFKGDCIHHWNKAGCKKCLRFSNYTKKKIKKLTSTK